MKDGLQVRLAAVVAHGPEVVDAAGQIARQGDVSEDLEVPGAQEAQAGAALDAPELAVGVDDAVAEEVPQRGLHEAALGKDGAVVPEDEVEVARVGDDDARRQAGDVQLERLAAEEALALGEPGEELLAGPEEVEAVADEGERIWWFPGAVVSIYLSILAHKSLTLFLSHSPQRVPVSRDAALPEDGEQKGGDEGSSSEPAHHPVAEDGHVR